MENNINAYCGICGHGYHVCMSCQESKISPWRSIVDNMEHYKIFLTIRDYENGYINKEKANKQLSNIDLSEIENFLPEIKAKIEEIMKVDNVVAEATNEGNKNISSSKKAK